MVNQIFIPSILCTNKLMQTNNTETSVHKGKSYQWIEVFHGQHASVLYDFIFQ